MRERNRRRYRRISDIVQRRGKKRKDFRSRCTPTPHRVSTCLKIFAQDSIVPAYEPLKTLPVRCIKQDTDVDEAAVERVGGGAHKDAQGDVGEGRPGKSHLSA
jgi:hypothetical protein